MEPLTVWTNAFLDPVTRQELTAKLAPHHLQVAAPTPDVLTPGAPDPEMANADVMFGQPDPRALLGCPRLRWVQISSAGYTRYDTPEFRAHVQAHGLLVTNSSAVYAEPCAQHALALLLANARQLYAAYDVQRTTRAWPQNELRSRCHLLGTRTIVLVGAGAIGARLTELLAPFGARVIGVRRRRPPVGSGIETVTLEGLGSALAEADDVVNLLPENASTTRFFDARRFAACKPGACYYSIGRGSTTDGEALQAALVSGFLAAAYLDVTDPEPLPPEDPLWSAPRLFITPHTSGGHANEAERQIAHFWKNFRRFERGEPLLDAILT